MHVLSSLKDYTAPLTEKVKEMREGLPGGEEKGDKMKPAGSDPEFEAARKDWQRLNNFCSTMLESVTQTTSALRDMSKPVDLMEVTVTGYFRETKVPFSKEVTQFTASVSKMKEGTMKFGEMMLSYSVKEELESWLAKLAEVKREINQRDALYLKYTKGEAEHKGARSKAEQKGMLRDAATVVKLNKMEAEWTGEKETFTLINAKVINEIHGMNSRIIPIVNEQVKTVATSQFWLFWALSEGFSHWHQQETMKSSMRQRRRQTNLGAARAGAVEDSADNTVPENPAGPKLTDSGKQLPPTPPKKNPPAPVGKALPTPPPKKTAGTTEPAPATAATPTPQSTTSVPAPVATGVASPASALSPSEQKMLELQMRNLDEEKEEISKERERLIKEWEDVENEKIRLIRIKKEELLKIEEVKQRNEDELKEKIKQLENKNQVLEAERKAVAEEKIRLEKRIKLEEERIEKRKQMEEEYKKMEEERKVLEEKKIEVAEGKMKKRLEEEWRRLEAKRIEIEEERKKEDERRRQEEEARILDEKKRVEWEAEERRKREEEASLEEEKERERLERIKRSMDEERRRLEMTKKRLLEEDDVLPVPEVIVRQTPAEVPNVKEAPAATTAAAPSTTPTTQPEDTPAATTVTSTPTHTEAATPAASTPDPVAQESATTKLLVKALYKYEAQEEGEMSFGEGEIMIADYDGDETGWWMAKKRNGEQGIVPANFVKKYDPEKDDVSVEAKKAVPASTPTTTETPTTSSEAVTTTTTTTPAPATTPVAVAPAEPQKVEPVQQPQPVTVQPQQQPPSTGYPSGLPTELGKVKALFDYKASEEGELSFKKDDVLTLLEKDNEGGWWIGELNGEMGLFPKTYVVELSSETAPVAAAPTTTTTTPAPTTTATTPAPTTTAPAETSPRKPFGGVKMFPDTAPVIPQALPEKKVEYVKALFEYTAQDETEVSFKEGDAIRVVDKEGGGNEGWWTGNVNGKTGTFPTNFTSPPYFA